MSNAAGFSGVGKVTLAPRLVSGLPGFGRFVGNCPKLDISFSPDAVERASSMDPSRGPLRRMTRATGAQIELVTDEFSKKNFALAVSGRVDAVAASGSAVTGQWLAGAAVGDTLFLPGKNVSNLVVTDSTGTPKTLASGQYTLDAFNGSLVLNDITTGGAYVQPFKYSYDRGAVDVISGLVVVDQELWLNMAGTNVDTGERGVLDTYRVRFATADLVSYINSDYNDFTLKGTVLQDLTKQTADVGGNFFKFTVPTTIA